MPSTWQREGFLQLLDAEKEGKGRQSREESERMTEKKQTLLEETELISKMVHENQDRPKLRGALEGPGSIIPTGQ